MKVQITFTNLLKEPFTVTTIETPRNELGCGYTDYTFFILGNKVYSYRQYNDFGYPNKVIELDVNNSVAVMLHDLGICKLADATYRALTK